MNKKFNKIIYYLPVDKEYISTWTWYRTDLECLTELANEVVVCKNIFELLKQIRGACLIYACWWHTSLPAIFISKTFKKKIACTGAIHMFDASGSAHFYSKSWFYRLSCAAGLRFADANFFLSNYQKYSICNNIKVSNPSVIYTSLPKNTPSSQKVFMQRKKYRPHGETKNNLVLSTILWQSKDQILRKGMYEILDALRIAKENSAFGFTFYLMGRSGNGTPKLRQLIKKYNLQNNIKIIENVSNSQREEILYLTDIYIQPSWHEGLGFAVIEAASLGAIPLVSKYAAQPETVGENGILVNEITGDSIFKSLKKFADLDQDNRKSLRLTTLNFVLEKFSSRNHINNLNEKLSEMVQG